MNDQVTLNNIVELLKRANLDYKINNIERCVKGGNNRLYRIETRNGHFAVKYYFNEKVDVRLRLNSEVTFVKYAQEFSQQVPKCYAYDTEHQLALFEFIEGEDFFDKTLTEIDIDAAINFFIDINQHKFTVSASKLPIASEACFSLQAHMDLLALRIDKLQHIPSDTTENCEAQSYIDKLATLWQQLKAKMHKLSEFNLLNLHAEIESSNRCISPSDFGFHNALKRHDGRVCFLDFEYAGWDDPGKMLGDFFSQLAVPVQNVYYTIFVNKISKIFPDLLLSPLRYTCLQKLYQLKWICIALNVFLPEHMQRRQFAHPDLDLTHLKRQQLAKVNNMIKKCEENDVLY